MTPDTCEHDAVADGRAVIGRPCLGVFWFCYRCGGHRRSQAPAVLL